MKFTGMHCRLWCRPTNDNSFNRALTSRASQLGLGTS